MAKLKITKTGYQVFFPKYVVTENLLFDPGDEAAF
jgi:hypothetical protein